MLASNAKQRLEACGKAKLTTTVAQQKANIMRYRKQNARYNRHRSIYRQHRNAATDSYRKGEMYTLHMVYLGLTHVRLPCDAPKYVKSFNNGIRRSLDNYI